eukprot:TRINITY_DN108_c8_g2_i1.p1 TRINITY_DN108_c8_g2~~TRINITY_DN108_c8_g2_i1.p1  ORF type:complete len:1167 (+),score=338.57 TRINITY_DN108_c8_g2_i1:63-3563(+)
MNDQDSLHNDLKLVEILSDLEIKPEELLEESILVDPKDVTIFIDDIDEIDFPQVKKATPGNTLPPSPTHSQPQSPSNQKRDTTSNVSSPSSTGEARPNLKGSNSENRRVKSPEIIKQRELSKRSPVIALRGVISASLQASSPSSSSSPLNLAASNPSPNVSTHLRSKSVPGKPRTISFSGPQRSTDMTSDQTDQNLAKVSSPRNMILPKSVDANGLSLSHKALLDQITVSKPEFVGTNPKVVVDRNNHSDVDGSTESDTNKGTVGASYSVSNELNDGFEEELKWLQQTEPTYVYFDPSELPPLIDDKLKRFSIEPLSNERPPNPQEILFPDIYDDHFYGKVHLNYVGVHKTKGDDYVIVSVLKPAQNGKYLALKTTKKGSESFEIDSNQIRNSKDGQKKKLSESIENYLNATHGQFSFYQELNTNFSNDLRMIEKKHPQKQKAFKLAFMYSTGQEKTLQDFFAHRDGSPEYFKFLDLLGEKINLKSHKGYRGDIGVEIEQDSYYTKWGEIEVMFHICLWFTPEQHRRLIGNDIVFVIFHDSTVPFDPAPLDALGTVPQVFGVVQKHEDNYRMAFFTRPNIKPFTPTVPANHAFAKDSIRDFLFEKAYNGYCQALSCPPMNRLFEVPRASTIEDLMKKYPRESGSLRKQREQEDKEKRKATIEKNKDPLLLLVYMLSLEFRTSDGKVINASNNNFDLINAKSDLLFNFTLLDQEEKKKMRYDKLLETAAPFIIPFNLVGIDPAVDFLKFELKEHTGKLAHPQMLGQCDIAFSTICDKWGTTQSIHLDASDAFTMKKIELVLNVKFDLKGTQAMCELCPKCKLFIGSIEFIVNTNRYHSRCVSCTKCHRKYDDSFTMHKTNFYCEKCIAKVDTKATNLSSHSSAPNIRHVKSMITLPEKLDDGGSGSGGGSSSSTGVSQVSANGTAGSNSSSSNQSMSQINESDSSFVAHSWNVNEFPGAVCDHCQKSSGILFNCLGCGVTYHKDCLKFSSKNCDKVDRSSSSNSSSTKAVVNSNNTNNYVNVTATTTATATTSTTMEKETSVSRMKQFQNRRPKSMAFGGPPIFGTLKKEKSGSNSNNSGAGSSSTSSSSTSSAAGGVEKFLQTFNPTSIGKRKKEMKRNKSDGKLDRAKRKSAAPPPTTSTNNGGSTTPDIKQRHSVNEGETDLED